MARSPVALALALAALGCAPEAPPAPIAREPPSASAAPERTAEPPVPPPIPTVATSAAPVASSAAPAPPAPPTFVLRELAPTQGDLTPLLRDEAKRAKEGGLIAVVYFYADWCAPCRVFGKNMRAPEIAAALEGVYLVKLNLDDWHDKLRGTGFAPRTIPSFYFVDAEGRPKGKLLDGDKWGKSSPSRMGAAIAEWLRGSAPPRRP